MKTDEQKQRDKELTRAALSSYTEWRLPGLLGTLLGIVVLVVLPGSVESFTRNHFVWSMLIMLTSFAIAAFGVKWFRRRRN